MIHTSTDQLEGKEENKFNGTFCVGMKGYFRGLQFKWHYLCDFILPQPLVIDTYMLQKLGQQIFVTNLEKNGEVWTVKEWKKLNIAPW